MMKILHSLLLRIVVCLYLVTLLSGCATTKANLPPEEPARHSVVETADDERILSADDPWVSFNKKMYNFNYYADKYVLLPVVKGYEFVTPEFAQEGVSNFFNNVEEVKTFYNSILQGKGMKSLNALGRFLTNSTIGIGGLFDVATRMGMERQPEDFGQTLAVWGVGSGPYVVLPLLGPNTVRSTAGFAVDTTVRSVMVNAVFEDVDDAWAYKTGLTVLDVIDTRHQQKFRYYKSHYPFEYDMVQLIYKQKRGFQIMK